MNPDENDHDDDKKQVVSQQQHQQHQEQLIIDTLKTYCIENSEFENLRSIGRALQQGGDGEKDELICELLSGGKTNYPYKVYLKENPDVAIFVKLAYPYALWSIDKSVPYTLARTENEYVVMKRFSNLFLDDPKEKAPVATPYLCVDVASDDNDDGVDKKLLVTEWASEADEQFARQFVDGVVDRRVMLKLARAFAVLNLVRDFDPDFNDDVRVPFRSAEPQMEDLFGNLINDDEREHADIDDHDHDDDDFIVLGRQIGLDGFRKLVDDMDKEYMRRDALVHGDAHPFNVLVERRTKRDEVHDDYDTATGNTRAGTNECGGGGGVSKYKYKFGEKGSVYICDWEMSFAGPVGMDPGKMQGWPIACALYHAIHGREDVANDLIKSVHEFWDAYAAVLVERGGMDERRLAKVYRSSIGWIAYFFVFVFYMLGIFVDSFPVDGLSDVQKRKAKGSLGALGLELCEYGFQGKDPDLNLQGLRSVFRSILAREVNKLLSFSRQDPLP